MYKKSGHSEYSELTLKWVSYLEVLKSVPIEDKVKQIIATSMNLIWGDKDTKPEIDYALMIIDDREHCKMVDEMLFHGNFYHPSHKWAYYEAYNN